jgi:mRNA interferase MazF
MPLPEALRGEVWDVDFAEFGEHPAVIVSANPPNRRLGHVVAVPVTGTLGPAATHVPLIPESGLTRYAESYADITMLQPVDRTCLLARRGMVALSELRRVEEQLRTYLVL